MAGVAEGTENKDSPLNKISDSDPCPCAGYPIGCALPLREHRSEAFGERFTAFYAGSDPFPHVVMDAGAPPPPTHEQLVAETRKRLDRIKSLRLSPPNPQP